MKICRVVGPVVATIKHASLRAQKTLLVEPIDERGTVKGASFIAVDSVQAGMGDVVMVMQEGSGARQILNDAKAPIRSMIVGIIDMIGEG